MAGDTERRREAAERALALVGGTLMRAAATGTAAVLAVACVLFAASGAAAQDGAIHPSDRAVLELLYHATDGPNWIINRGWLTDERHWFGVATDHDTGRVYDLRLQNNNLSGPIPPELGQLTHLTGQLELYGNNLSGPIPPGLGQLADLDGLVLSRNNLSGPIPPGLGQLANLTGLYLNDNNLSGPIPPGLGQLANLDYLDLLDNNLSGPIPPELAQLTKLKWINLDPDTGLCLPMDFPHSVFGRMAQHEEGVPFCSSDEPLWCPVTQSSSCQVNASNGCETCSPECKEARVEAEKLLAGIPFGEVGLLIICKLSSEWCQRDLLRKYREVLTPCIKSSAVALGVRGLTGAIDGWDIEMESSDPSVLQVVEDAESITLVKHKAGPVALRITGTNSSEGVVARVSHHLMIGSTAVPRADRGSAGASVCGARDWRRGAVAASAGRVVTAAPCDHGPGWYSFTGSARAEISLKGQGSWTHDRSWFD